MGLNELDTKFYSFALDAVHVSFNASAQNVQ